MLVDRELNDATEGTLKEPVLLRTRLYTGQARSPLPSAPLAINRSRSLGRQRAYRRVCPGGQATHRSGGEEGAIQLDGSASRCKTSANRAIQGKSGQGKSAAVVKRGEGREHDTSCGYCRHRVELVVGLVRTGPTTRLLYLAEFISGSPLDHVQTSRSNPFSG